VNTSLQVVKW